LAFGPLGCGPRFAHEGEADAIVFLLQKTNGAGWPLDPTKPAAKPAAFKTNWRAGFYGNSIKTAHGLAII
jgi:hypothetical protein